jgi:pimeloyl-ACP methyl ester carboxylesterase
MSLPHCGSGAVRAYLRTDPSPRPSPLPKGRGRIAVSAVAILAAFTFARATENLSRAESFDSKGISIHYTIEGKGQPVLLIHGLFADASLNWGGPGIIKALSKDYQVIAMDVRGHGLSDKPEQEDAYGLQMVEDVIRLLDHLKIQKAHVVGYSMGGMITMKFLTLHPERVRSAVLGGMGWLQDKSALQDFFGRLPERKGLSGTPRACPRSFGALAVTAKEVKAIRVPVSVLVGENDPVKKLYVDPLEQLRPDWPVKVIAGAGHLGCVVQPEFKVELKNLLDHERGR